MGLEHSRMLSFCMDIASKKTNFTTKCYICANDSIHVLSGWYATHIHASLALKMSYTLVHVICISVCNLH